jgi:hypothetical protein
MRHPMNLTMLSFAVLVLGCAVSEADSEKKAKGKGVVVQLDEFKSTTPGEWKEEAPENTMRYAQFLLPKAKDDKKDANLVIFKGLGGGVTANIKRWKDQFIPPEGKTIDDVAKVSTIKIGSKEATMLDVSGTYKFKARPFDPQSKEEQLPNYRMLAIYFDGEAPYQIRLTGPAKTVDSYKKGFDEWIKGFK